MVSGRGAEVVLLASRIFKAAKLSYSRSGRQERERDVNFQVVKCAMYVQVVQSYKERPAKLIYSGPDPVHGFLCVMFPLVAYRIIQLQ